MDGVPTADGRACEWSPVELLNDLERIAGDLVRAYREMEVLHGRLDPSWGMSMPVELALRGLSAALVSCDEIVIAGPAPKRISSHSGWSDGGDGASWSDVLHK
jgi:hypothetical protein